MILTVFVPPLPYIAFALLGVLIFTVLSPFPIPENPVGMGSWVAVRGPVLGFATTDVARLWQSLATVMSLAALRTIISRYAAGFGVRGALYEVWNAVVPPLFSTSPAELSLAAKPQMMMH